MIAYKFKKYIYLSSTSNFNGLNKKNNKKINTLLLKSVGMMSQN